MDFILKFFSSKKSSNKETSTNPNIIFSLREQIEMIEKRKELFQQKQTQLTLEATNKSKSGDKKGALLLLNKRKLNETEIEKMTSNQLLLEKQLFTLEGATMNKEVIDTLKIGTDAIKNINKDININVIEEIIDDMQESQDISTQIQTLMNEPLQKLYEDEELLADLKELEGLADLEVKKNNTNTNTNVFSAPSVPTTEPRKNKESYDIKFLLELE